MDQQGNCFVGNTYQITDRGKELVPVVVAEQANAFRPQTDSAPGSVETRWNQMGD